MINNVVDQAIIVLLQDDLPLESRPFYKLAQQLGISEQEIVDRIRNMQQTGILRRWGAVLRHQQAGYLANAMVGWKVTAAQADKAGNLMAGFKEVSHCYLRKVPDSFAFRLFTMVHAHNQQELRQIISEISQCTDLKDYIIINSVKEYKKASMKYI